MTADNISVQYYSTCIWKIILYLSRWIYVWIIIIIIILVIDTYIFIHVLQYKLLVRSIISKKEIYSTEMKNHYEIFQT